MEFLVWLCLRHGDRVVYVNKTFQMPSIPSPGISIWVGVHKGQSLLFAVEEVMLHEADMRWELRCRQRQFDCQAELKKYVKYMKSKGWRCIG